MQAEGVPRFASERRIKSCIRQKSVSRALAALEGRLPRTWSKGARTNLGLRACRNPFQGVCSKGNHLENPRRKLLSLCTFPFRWVLVLFVGLLWMRGPYLIPSRWLGIRFSHQELKPWLKPERALASSETRVSEVVRNRLRNHPQQVSFPKNQRGFPTKKMGYRTLWGKNLKIGTSFRLGPSPNLPGF